jgi:hypothetical protein
MNIELFNKYIQMIESLIKRGLLFESSPSIQLFKNTLGRHFPNDLEQFILRNYED